MIYLTKHHDGHFLPSSDEDAEECRKITVGSEVKCTRSRNPDFHRKAMKLLHLGFENQDVYNTFEIYRKIVTIKAGYFDEIEIIKGEVIPQAHSLSYDSMSGENFEKWYNDVLILISNDMQTLPEEIQKELNGFV